MHHRNTRIPLRLLFALSVLSSLLALPAPALRAQSSASVDPADPIYRAIDLFIAEGLIDSVVVGQRPYSRREVARLVAIAARHRARLEQGFADRSLTPAERAILAHRLHYTNALLDQARQVYGVDTIPVPHMRSASEITTAGRLDRVTLEGTSLASVPRVVPNGGIGGIDAVTNPLADNRQGRDYADGGTVAVEGAWHADAGPYASLNMAFDARHLELHGGQRTTAAHAQVLSVATFLRNVRIDLGRDYITWGQTPLGGLAFSTNAPALGMFRVASDAPFLLPWFLRYAGPLRASLVVADLGTHRDHAHAKLVGYKISAVPWRRLELGVTVLDELGGVGTPPVSVGDRIADVFPFVDAIFFHKTNVTFSNKLAGGDIRLRFPEANGLELYGEMLLDDFDLRRVKSSLWQDDGIIAGLSVPRLASDGTFRLDAELHHTGLRYYQHDLFDSGVTYDQRMLGDALGPRANAGYLTIRWATTTVHELAINVAIERRSNDQYVLVSDDAQSTNFRFEKTEDRPEETRKRLTLAWSNGSTIVGLRGVLEAGWEHVSQFDFTTGVSRSNALARLTLEYRP